MHNIYTYKKHNKLNNWTITMYCILEVSGNSYFLPSYLCVTSQV